MIALQNEKYIQISSNVSKLYNSEFYSDMSGNICRYDIQTPLMLDINNALNIWDITNNAGTFVYLSSPDAYLYSWGTFPYGYSPLGIELNPGETEIEMPVQILFPAGWNS